MIKFLSLFSVLLFSLLINVTFAQMQNPEDKVRSSIRLEQNDCDLTVVVDVDIVDGWHINSHVLPEGSWSIPSNILLKTKGCLLPEEIKGAENLHSSIPTTISTCS